MRKKCFSRLDAGIANLSDGAARYDVPRRVGGHHQSVELERESRPQVFGYAEGQRGESAQDALRGHVALQEDIPVVVVVPILCAKSKEKREKLYPFVSLLIGLLMRIRSFVFPSNPTPLLGPVHIHKPGMPSVPPQVK